MSNFDFSHFLAAQESIFPLVLQELRQGRKRNHWMWFIFPQLQGLGHSAMAQRFALESAAHAQAYLAHPVLGPRLVECCELLTLHPDKSATVIFGYPDNLKIYSSLSLFAQAAGENSLFNQLLHQLRTVDED